MPITPKFIPSVWMISDLKKGMIMDRQETLKLLDDYIAALNTKKENEERITKLNRDVGITYDPNDGYALIRFLWPFLVGAPFGAALFVVLLMILTRVEYGSEVYFCYFFGIILYFVMAFVIATLLRKNANKKLYKQRVDDQEHEDAKAKEMIADLKRDIDKADEFIAANKELIPAACRNAESLKRIRSDIFRGKAESIEDAVNK